MIIRRAEKKDFEICVDIVKALPEWFNEVEILDISSHLKTLSTLVAIEDNIVVAFVILEDKSADTVEIKHLAVSRNHQHVGIGTELLKYIEKKYSDKTNIEVKTLDESAEYEPYVSTRSFYEKNGFVKVAVIDPHPGWSPGNPCAVYRKWI